MSDTLSRIKLQLRPVNGSVLNGSGDDKTPTSPSSKLLINHGKPNYTIQRSPNAQRNGDTSPLSDELQNNNRNNYYPYKSAGVKGTTGVITNGSNGKSSVAINNNNNNSNGGDDLIIQSTKFNGVFKPANVQKVETKVETDNQVLLRRVPKPEAVSAPQNDSDENVPEFILRQRRIQERLAKENVLDFENRRSGYFTHVVISPTSPNRTSLVETMSSPPIVPSLEIPPPAKEAREASIVEESSVEVSAAKGEAQAHDESQTATTNGHVEEEEVARAIEEVNKAVAGEVDDEKPDVVEDEKPVESEKVADIVKVEVAQVAEAAVVDQKSEESKVVEQNDEEHKVEESKVEEAQISHVSVVATSPPVVEAEATHKETVESTPEPVVTSAQHVEAVVEPPTPVEPQQSVVEEQPKENGHADVVEPPKTNGHITEDVTISHTNGVTDALATPSLPKPDPSGALGVNYEPKTVVSFSKDLGEPNKYPDTVVKTEVDGVVPASDELKDLAKLKFDIKADDTDVQVTPVLRTE